MKKHQKYGRNQIFKGHDEYGPVEVVEDRNVRSLHFGTSNIQSEMSLTNPYELTVEYIRLMALALLYNPTPKSALILGVGGGSLTKFIWKYFPSCTCDLVERSPLVADISERFFEMPKNSRLRWHITDALNYIRSTKERYDLIFIDLFQAEGISQSIAESEFFEHCHKRLRNKSSVIVWHIWRQTNPDFLTKCINHLCEHFGRNILILPDSEGRDFVFLIFNQKMPQESAFTLMEQARALKQKTGLDFPEMFVDFMNWMVGTEKEP